MIPAPYPRGQSPSSDALIATTGAQLRALQVSKAKVIANRTLRGNLAFIAEAPARFRGSVDVAGNELVTLAFHEQGYALRYKMDAFPAGFYEGPPSACAVEALLGVSFDTEGLVDLVLGGSPVIAAPYEVLDQQWDKRGGYESLTIANEQFVQELRFGFVGNEWRVMGGQLWERVGKDKGRRLWTVEHLELEPQGGYYLPTKTKVSTPGKRRDDTVMINYKERDPDPAFAKNRPSSGGDSGDGGNDGGGDDGDPWENDDPWEEDGDEGWEDEAPTTDGANAGPTSANGETTKGETTTKGESPAGGTSTNEATTPGDPPPTEATTPEPSPKTDAPPPAVGREPEPPAIPPEFQLEPAGLTARGDLCR